MAWAPNLHPRSRNNAGMRADAWACFFGLGLLGSVAVLLLRQRRARDQMMTRIMSVVFMIGIGL